MAALDPDPRAVGANFDLDPSADRNTKSGLCAQLIATFFETSIKNENLYTAFIIGLDLGAGVPALDPDILAIVLIEWDNGNAGTFRVGKRVRLVEPDAHVIAVIGIKLPEFHEDHATAVRPRRMARFRWVADIGTGWKVTVLVLKDPLEDNELLAAGVDVGSELTARVVADDRRGMSALGTDSIQHPTLDACHPRGRSVDVIAIHDDAFGGVCIHIHGFAPLMLCDDAALSDEANMGHVV